MLIGFLGLTHMLKTIHAQEKLMTDQRRVSNVIQTLRDQRLTRAAGLFEDHVNETLTYYAFSD